MDDCPDPRWHFGRILKVSGKVLHHMWVLSRLECFYYRIRNQVFKNALCVADIFTIVFPQYCTEGHFFLKQYCMKTMQYLCTGSLLWV